MRKVARAQVKILATVNFGKNHITTSWEFINGRPDPFLLITRDLHGHPFVLLLDKRLVKNEGVPEIAEKRYLGGLNASDAFILEQA